MDEVVRRIERAEELGFDSAWLMDHAFLDFGSRRTTGHDPMVALSYAAARTRRIRLGTLVLCAPFRHPAQVAREAAALADASGGRFILGLGAGWHQPEFEAWGLPFDHLVARFEEHLVAVRRLLAGERFSAAGRYVRLEDAETLASAPPPDVWVAAKGPRMLRLTAAHADGWNVAWGDGSGSTAWLEEPAGALRRELEAAGRDRTRFTISAALRVAPEEGPEPVARLLRSYEQAGVDLVILSLTASAIHPTRPEYIETAAQALSLAFAGPSLDA